MGNKMSAAELRRILECPVCLGIKRNPVIYLCVNSHIICGDCKPRVEACPIARCPYAEPTPRSLQTENMIRTLERSLDFECRNKGRGCERSGDRSGMEEHEKECEFRRVPCPQFCQDLPSFKDLKSHVEESHPFKTTENTSEWIRTISLNNVDFSVPANIGSIWMHEFDGHTFVCPRIFCNFGYLYLWIAIWGGESEAKRYRVTIRASGNVAEFKKICNVFPIDSCQGDIMRNEKCFLLHDKMARQVFDEVRAKGEEDSVKYKTKLHFNIERVV